MTVSTKYFYIHGLSNWGNLQHKYLRVEDKSGPIIFITNKSEYGDKWAENLYDKHRINATNAMEGFLPHTKIITTKKGTLVLVPDNHSATLAFYIEGGFRGTSTITDIQKEGDIATWDFYFYRSPRGRLGKYHGLIASGNGRLIIKWKRDGRLYGKPAFGISVIDINPDGYKIQDYPGVEELEDV